MLSDDRQLIETPISDETVFRGALIDVSHMQVRLPNGRTALREIVHHKGAAAIVPVDDEEYVYLVRQHRVVNDMLTWEIPAGKLDTADEDPLHCAVRELRRDRPESRAYGKIEPYRHHAGLLYREDRPVSGHRPEPARRSSRPRTNFSRVTRIPLKEAVQRVMSGEFQDAKTALGLLMAWQKRLPILPINKRGVGTISCKTI